MANRRGAADRRLALLALRPLTATITYRSWSRLMEVRMDVITYKGFEVRAAPYQLADNGEWQINLYILRQGESETKARNFSAANSYKTLEEAVQHCIQFGKQIIDGQSANCSVADL